MYCLTLYHTILTFKDMEKIAFRKKLWEKEKMLVTSIFSFSHNLFYLFKIIYVIIWEFQDWMYKMYECM